MTPARHLDRRDPMLRQYAACRCHADIGQHENVELIVSHGPDPLQKSPLTEYRATELSQRSKSLRDFVQVSIECIEEERIVVVWQLGEPIQRPARSVVVFQLRRCDTKANLRSAAHMRCLRRALNSQDLLQNIGIPPVQHAVISLLISD